MTMSRSTRSGRPIRLTRRGRGLVVLVVAAVALAGFGMGALRAMATTADDLPAHKVVTIRPGDTLWALARRVNPGGDPRTTIERIKDQNNLTTSAVQVGQRVVVPTGRSGK
jgi:nucleoid-associated protein YgaU